MSLVHGVAVGLVAPVVPMAQGFPPSTGLQAIGGRLRLLRLASGLSQVSWCRLVGSSVQAWNNYERGRKRISIDQALHLSIKTGASLDWIYRGVESAMPVQTLLGIKQAEEKATPPAPIRSARPAQRSRARVSDGQTR